jgi:hypothetical protein
MRLDKTAADKFKIITGWVQWLLPSSLRRQSWGNGFKASLGKKKLVRPLHLKK